MNAAAMCMRSIARASLLLVPTLAACSFDLPPLASETSQDGGDAKTDAVEDVVQGEDGAPIEDVVQAEDGAQPGVGRVGLALMPYRLGQRSADDWLRAVQGLSHATSYENRPTLALTVCGAEAGGWSKCLFPAPANLPSSPNVAFESDDLVSAVLEAAELRGVEVILGVQPNGARTADLIRAVMTAFGDRASLVGFSVDWGWAQGDPDKTILVGSWLSAVHGYRAGIDLYLVGWDPDSFGAFRDPHVAFGYAGENFAPDGLDDPELVLSTQLAAFGQWTQHFDGSRTGWHWGFATDTAWTQPLCQSTEELRDLQDRYLAIDPQGMLFMADESLFFEIEGLLPSAPMR
jgi:hypothetical protein